uniref:Uncharacterized protein n=1 Tax=Ascaris lumbricoides TaxID=6252 RepID=A0A0M3IEW5_ASCLU
MKPEETQSPSSGTAPLFGGLLQFRAEVLTTRRKRKFDDQ